MQHAACNGNEASIHNFSRKKLVGKRTLERYGRRSGNNIKLDIKETVYQGVVWMQLAQNRNRWRAVVNSAMNLGCHKGRGIF